jgi:hypothetical protein
VSKEEAILTLKEVITGSTQGILGIVVAVTKANDTTWIELGRIIGFTLVKRRPPVATNWHIQ